MREVFLGPQIFLYVPRFVFRFKNARIDNPWSENCLSVSRDRDRFTDYISINLLVLLVKIGNLSPSVITQSRSRVMGSCSKLMLFSGTFESLD